MNGWVDVHGWIYDRFSYGTVRRVTCNLKFQPNVPKQKTKLKERKKK